jgi:hypothetical protein
MGLLTLAEEVAAVVVVALMVQMRVRVAHTVEAQEALPTRVVQFASSGPARLVVSPQQTQVISNA